MGVLMMLGNWGHVRAEAPENTAPDPALSIPFCTKPPTIDGKLIRISFPELSTERREEFTKVVKKMAEEGRVAVRHVRREAIEHLKKAGKAGGVTEDEEKHAEKEVQKLHDKFIGRIDEHVTHKEQEIMTV